MKRSILAFLAGLVVWVLVAALLNRGVRMALPGYAAAEPLLTFTLAMKLSRIVLAAVASVAAGAVIAAIAPRSRRVPMVFGIVVLAAFLPEHIHLWEKFPAWYHLTFLLTLVPLVMLGAAMARKNDAPSAALELQQRV